MDIYSKTSSKYTKKVKYIIGIRFTIQIHRFFPKSKVTKCNTDICLAPKEKQKQTKKART